MHPREERYLNWGDDYNLLAGVLVSYVSGCFAVSVPVRDFQQRPLQHTLAGGGVNWLYPQGKNNLIPEKWSHLECYYFLIQTRWTS